MFSVSLEDIYMKKWIIKGSYNSTIEYHGNKLINSLLSSRNICDEVEIEDFFHPNISKLHNPFLLTDMDKAIDRIDRAIEKRQKLVIYGDYDVDGITSTAILFRAFQKLGADVSYYIPDRMSEGYGINKGAIDYIKSLQTDLIITVDCGITAIDEVNYTKSLGMDIIITDHHECKENIPETIVINPKRKDCTYPNKNLAGCGIAFKLVQALWLRYNLLGFEDFLDLAAIGTIADIVELRDENRIIVKNGLMKINRSDKCGIKALKSVSEIGDTINTYNVAFQIAPRINAVGRLSDAKIAVELFVTNDYDKALQIAKFLDMENKRRQKIEENILNEALKMVEEQVNLKTDKVIVLLSEKWHHGVVGIVASKLVERFNRPVILLCGEGDTCKGSGRSIPGFNLFNGLTLCNDLLIKFGGHEMAAGLTIKIKAVEELRQRLNDFGNKLDSEIYIEKIHAEVKTETEDISMDTAELLKLFEPYGNGNPSPLLYMEDLKLVDMKGIGSEGQHLKVNLEKDGFKYDGILFNGSSSFLNRKMDKVDILYNLEINEWKNNRNLQFLLKGIRQNSCYLKDTLKENYFRYVKFMFSENEEDYNFENIKFIKKDLEFFKEFIHLNWGYVLVSSYKALEELNFIFDYIEINPNKNIGNKGQVIVCPDIENIETLNNDILIYDFLPGLYEYNKLASKTTGNIYNFVSDDTINILDDFINTIKVDDDILEHILRDLEKGEITCSVKDLSIKYNRNPYLVYKLIMFLKDNNYADIFIKNDILKIRLKKAELNKLESGNGNDIHVTKIIDLKTKLKDKI